MNNKSGVINTVLLGRLGNNMFQYAFVRALQLKFYPKYRIHLNGSYFPKMRDELRLENFENHLCDFNITSVTCSDEPPIKLRTFTQLVLTVADKFIFKKIRRRNLNAEKKFFRPLLNFFGMYSAPSDDYSEPKPSYSRRIYCCAMFQNAEYFDSIRDVLLEDFTPKYDVLPKNAELLREIQASESVCVHIRRGDYLSPNNASVFNVCTEEYFITAMKAIREEIPNCKFFIFSDDVEDVKKNIRFPFEVTYNNEHSPVWEDLRLMYSCKHFVISNSTFSWWAQYLGRNPQKIVYAPIPWMWRSYKFEGLYLPYMRTIECHKH